MGFIADIFGASKAAKAQEKAADKAAQASQYATDQSTALQKAMFDRIWGATQGARDLGDSAIGKLNGLQNGTQNALAFTQATPGYQTNLDAGQRQLNASLAAKGGLLSGDAAREGLKYGADYATNVFNTERNALMAQAGLGQTAVNTGANAGQSSANAQQNALMNNANNLGQSYYNTGDAQAGMWGSIAGTLGSKSVGNALGTLGKFMGF